MVHTVQKDVEHVRLVWDGGDGVMFTDGLLDPGQQAVELVVRGTGEDTEVHGEQWLISGYQDQVWQTSVVEDVRGEGGRDAGSQVLYAVVDGCALADGTNLILIKWVALIRVA